MSQVEQLITENLDIWSSAIKSKSTSGRGSNGKTELYGIKKLRELILELAVRGLLVPQDPNDEPASVLLEKIAAEKARLVEEGKIKKQQNLPAIGEDEIPFELPNGWGWSRLGLVTNYGLSDKVEPSKVHPDTWVLELEDVEKETSRLIQKVRFSERQFKSSKNVFESGDVIYGKLRPYLDKVLVADEAGVCTTEMIPLRAYNSIIPAMLRLIMKSPYFKEYANNSTHGMNLPRMGTDKARLALVPVLPEAEQPRIVAKVDELMALCDQLEQHQESSISAHQTLVETLLAALTNASEKGEFTQAWARIAEHFDTLFTTEHSIDQLKQTILQLAVMGKLDPQDPNDEPASLLLEKIAAEKDRLVKEGKIKKQKPLPTIGEDEKPFELPEGWEWCRLDDLALHSEAGWSPKCSGVPRSGDNWGVLKVSAVTWGKFKPEENKELPSNLEPRKQYEVQSGDFLISRANTADLVARAVVVPESTPKNLMMSDKIIRFVFSKLACSEYVNLFNNSQLSRGYYASVAGGTSSSMKNVSREQIRYLLIALPPISEAGRILSVYEDIITLCENLKARIRESQTTQLHLADAMAEQALN